MDFNNLYNIDCFEGMERLLQSKGKGCIDLIISDLPYGQTENDWDVILPPEKLWYYYKQLIKDNGAIIIFGQGMFTATMMASNPSWWRYNLIWDKDLSTGFLNANKMPLRVHEDILVFYQKLPTYNPQKFKGDKPNHSRGKMINAKTSKNYGKYDHVDNREKLGYMKHPTSILRFRKLHPSKCIHPTEKPVSLLEFLIKSYSNEGDAVLDHCFGSASTIVGCINTNRQYIGFEKDENYFKLGFERVEDSKFTLFNFMKFF